MTLVAAPVLNRDMIMVEKHFTGDGQSRPTKVIDEREAAFLASMGIPVASHAHARGALGGGKRSEFATCIPFRPGEKPVTNPLLPKKFRFLIEHPGAAEVGLGRMNFNVELHGDVLVDTVSGVNGEPPRVERSRPNMGEWSAFRHKLGLKGIDIWSWADQYDSSMAIAARWEVEIVYADRAMRSSGRNWQSRQFHRVMRLARRVRFLMQRSTLPLPAIPPNLKG